MKSMLTAVLIISSFLLTANNIQVSNGLLTGHNYAEDYCLIQFDLSWENSWRTSTAPNNWDAAWVFVKYRYPAGDWKHLMPSTTNYSGPGDATIDIPDDSTGAFVYRSTDGEGDNTWTGFSLRWNYGVQGVPDDAVVEIKIFAVEMVHIPQGAFYLGDTTSSDSFYEVGTPNDFYYVDGSTITVGTATGNLYASGDVGINMEGVSITSTYPTGYSAFYCMKYEMSQEQYVDFLNCLTRTQQNTRTNTDVSADTLPANRWYVMNKKSSIWYRNSITCNRFGLGTTHPITFYCDLNDNEIGNESDDGLNIPISYITWMDFAAYADWAGLRPMTEGEYEKACRGPNTPVPGEYAWGNASIHNQDYDYSQSGYADENIINLGEMIGNAIYTATANNNVPARCGIISASAMIDPNVGNTRMETGGSYYGVMEMSGNMKELVVAMLNLAGISYLGHHGDGTLLHDGSANVDYWPGINGNSDHNTPNTVFSGTGVTHAGGSDTRGNYFLNGDATLSVSYRYSTFGMGAQRDESHGIRLGRTAP